jgi:hypothetical protein
MADGPIPVARSQLRVIPGQAPQQSGHRSVWAPSTGHRRRMGRVSFCGVLTGNRPAGHKQHIRAGHVGKGRADAQVHQVDMVVDHTGVSAQRTVCAPGRYARIS